jgi:hypothetical protein
MKTKLLFFLSVAFITCSRNDIKVIDSIKRIDITSKSESAIEMLSDLASDIEYIPLQTNENSLVGDIFKIVASGNNLFIQNSINEILCFDKTGKFLFKLNKTGRGPNEYKFIVDFDVSSDGKTLLILSGDKILLYNNSDSGFFFKKSLNLNRPVPSKIDMVPGTSNVLLSIDPLTGSEYSLNILININGDTLNLKPNYYKFKKVDKFTRGLSNESLHAYVGNTLYFKEEFSDTVFSINKESNKFRPKLIFDSHGFGFSPRARYDTEYARKHASEIFWVNTLIEIPRYIIYTFEHNKSRNKILYDKLTNKKYQITLNAFKDDLIGGISIDPKFCIEGKILTSVEALNFKNYISGEDFIKAKVRYPKRKNELKKLAESLNETDNPILIIIIPKE